MNSTGVTGLSATLVPGTLSNGIGTITYDISGTPNTSGNAIFNITFGGRSCSFTKAVLPSNQPSVSSLGCATAIINGTPTPGTAFSGSATINYSGGNGASYSASSTMSTGVTGLMATLIAGTLTNGAGILTYLITGTPSAAGTAAFAITFGGQTCTLNINVPAPPAIAAKWFYSGRVDSAYCCLPGARSGAPLVPYTAADSNIQRTFTQNTYYYQFGVNMSFQEYYLDGANYSGTYTYGYSSSSLADTLNAIYGASDIQYWRVNAMTANTLVLRDRGWYTQASSGRGVLPNGDTLVYRLIWNFNK